MSKIKVLHIIRRAEGGMKKHLLSILNMMDMNKYMVAVACHFDKKTKEDLRCKDINVYDVDISDNINLKADIYSIMELKHAIKVFAPDIVHIHGAKASLVGRIACMGKKCKIVVTVHNFPGYDKMHPLKRDVYLFINKYLNKRTSQFIAVSDALKNEIIKYEGIEENQIKTIYNCIDNSTYKINSTLNLRKEYNLPAESLIVGSVARLIPSKGIQDLVNAANLLRDINNLYFIVAGDGPMMTELKKMVNYHKLENFIFTGFRDDIPDFLRNLDIFVLPSHQEGFGLSIIEAMFQGKPVIATNVGGIPEILKNSSYGIIINSGDVNALSKYIKKLVNDSELRKKLSQFGKEYVINKFSCEKMYREIDSIYENLTCLNL
ncbi:MAG: glycosyltransferase family 4 protein [Thermoanaerobacteraceae bacterium]|nr:glycosyltransferase family 4 protein [Thermoanaerobacteraceae bacterium]